MSSSFMSVSVLRDSTSTAYKKAQRIYQKTTKNRNSAIEADWSPFRTAEKYYKARFPPPNLSNVLDLATRNDSRSHEIDTGIWLGCGDAVATIELHANDASDAGKAYTIPSVPGLVVLPSFLSQQKQRDLIIWALRDQAKHPNPTNLDIHYQLPQEGLWNMHLQTLEDAKQHVLVQPRTSNPSTPSEYPGPRKLVNNEPASSTNLKSILNTPKTDAAPSSSARPTVASELCRKLRWANIGWFYHWGTKQYDFARGKAPVDDILRDICKDAVRTVDWEKVYGSTELDWGEEAFSWIHWNDSYEPDAGIVNFYQTKDTLMAHVDRSEVCATAPLVSVSLGNAAVFLIGGQTRDTEPTPILLRSGDVVIMSGPACRRAYHGVPRILEGTLPPHLSGEGEAWAPYAEFMKSTRININVRQVFTKDFYSALEGVS